MHMWGSPWKYWDQLSKAMYDIQKTYKRLTLGGIILMKEKWGLIRYEYYPLGPKERLYQYVWKPFQKLYDTALFRNYLQWALAYAIVKAVRKYPMIRDEILEDVFWYLSDTAGDYVAKKLNMVDKSIDNGEERCFATEI